MLKLLTTLAGAQLAAVREVMAEIGIDRYFTYIVTKSVKSLTQMPVATLMALERS